MDNKTIGRRIKNIRLKLGMTTDKFAKEFKVKPPSKGTVSKWENGHYLPNNERLKRIAELGEISINELLYGTAGTKMDDWIDESKKQVADHTYNYLKNATPEESFTLAKYIELLEVYSNNPKFVAHFQSLFFMFIDDKKKIEDANTDELEEIIEYFQIKIKHMIESI